MEIFNCMTNIIRALEEIEKERFSHIIKGALKTVLTIQQSILALKQKIKTSYIF